MASKPKFKKKHLTQDDVYDLLGDGRLELVHDLEHALVLLVAQLEVDVRGEEGTHNVDLAADGRLVEGAPERRADVDVEAGAEEHLHNFPEDFFLKLVVNKCDLAEF